MDRQQILNLYEWEDGVCFRHPSRGTQATALIKTLHLRSGRDRQVRACEACVLCLEKERERAATAAGRTYRPGPAGDDASPTRADPHG